MPVIVFIIDNSASMNQVTYLGTTYLDLAKGAVENFIKIRGRDSMSARNDRYMLLTLDEPPTNIKVGWKENMSIFNNELKNLKAHGITNLNPVLKQAFDLLNLNRLSSGMDTFGMGRCPFYLEPSIIILITDRSQLLNTSQTYDELNLPMTNAPAGSELTLEPFRWDQRFFLISLSMNAVPYAEPGQNTYIPVSQSPINSMCEVTGGRSYLISSQRMLFQCLESLVAKIQPGVVVNFEKFGPDPPALKANDDVMMMDRAWEKCKRMIFIPRNPATKGYIIGHWPLPEDYWLTLNSSIVPKRNAHPFIRFKCEPCDPLTIEDIPFDKYELEPSPLTQFILERRQPNVAWQCFIQNSGAKPNDFGYPFGYLKASSNMMTVCLIVLPYNYPVLFQLMNELFQILKLKPTKSWLERFDMYLKTIPPYYYAPLRRVLAKKGLQHLIPENLENFLSAQVQSYLKKIKIQAKQSFDQVSAHPALQYDTMGLLSNYPASFLFKRQQTDSYVDNRDFTSWLQSHMDPQRAESIRAQLNDYTSSVATFALLSREKKRYGNSAASQQTSKFDLPRSQLVSSLYKMRKAFANGKLNSLTGANTMLSGHYDDDLVHSLPIQDMGNYHEYLKSQTAPLREIEAQLVRQHMFGNPFKLVSKDQKNAGGVGVFGADEIDELLEESAENQIQNNGQKSQQAMQQQQQQLYQQQQQGRRGPRQRRSVKGPLSKRINYLRGLYRSNSSNLSSSSPSEASSIIAESDIESLDYNDNSTLASRDTISSDVGNMNDFIDMDTDNMSSMIIVEDKPDVEFENQAEVQVEPKLFELDDEPELLSIDSSMEEIDDSTTKQTETDTVTVDTKLTNSTPTINLGILTPNGFGVNNSSALCDNYLEQTYIQQRILCIEQIKRPGREYTRLFQLMNDAPLSLRMKLLLIRELCFEASRFKRAHLIEMLNKYASLLQQLVTTHQQSTNSL